MIYFVVLPVTFNAEQAPSIAGPFCFMIIPMMLLKVGSYYIKEKREIELFLLKKLYKANHRQLKELLNLLPEAVIVTSEHQTKDN